MKRKERESGKQVYMNSGSPSESAEMLNELESNYRSIFNNATDAIYIQDRDGVFIDVNPAATRMYGYTREEMVGSTPEKLSAENRNDLEKTWDYLQKAYNGEPQRFEWWGKRKNGEIFPKEVVMNRGFYFGEVVVFAMARDITEQFKALEALKESEDKYRSLTDQLPIGVYRTTSEGKLLYSNPALVKILGYDSAEELLEVNVGHLYKSPSNRKKQLQKSIEHDGIISSQFQLIRKSGELIWVKDNSRLMFNREGEPVYFDGILEDITEAKKAENSVKESEANLKAIIENTLENIWSVDLDYKIQYVNQVFVEAFYNTFGVKLGKGINIIESLPVELRNLWKERYDRTFKNEHFLFEDRVDIEENSIFVEVAMNPIVIDGKVVGASMYGKDVTEKKFAQTQLQYLSDLRKLLIELSTNFINLPVNSISPAIHQSLMRIGKFVGAARTYIYDYDFNSNTVTNKYEWCRKGISPQLGMMRDVPLDTAAKWVACHRRGEMVIIDDFEDPEWEPLRILLKEPVAASILTIPLMKGADCIGFVGFDKTGKKHNFTGYEKELLQVYAQTLVNVMERIDIEETLIKAKEKAEESDRLKSAFLANMSHEIRTPMSGIIGFLELLREPDLSEENKLQYIDIVTKSSHRLLDTINDIIEVSKIETGELQVNMSEVNINELLSYYHGFFKQQADQKGLEYRVRKKIPEGYASILIDRNKLESILSNLLKNAIKFTQHGSVELECHVSGNELVFNVMDTGVGIPPDRINTVFDRFVQVDMSGSRPHEGSGLGLSIVKAYTTMMGGRIHVTSEPGKGSTFSCYLPIKTPTGKSNEMKKEKSEVIKISNRQGKVLIAEDDYASYLYLENLLSDFGFTFIRTTNGKDTVEMIRKNPDIILILLDIRMPGMSGVEAVKLIREFNTRVPVIAQTAYALTGDREMVLAAGCNEYISKPVNKTQLLKIIQKITGISEPKQ